MNGADLLARTLLDEGVDTCFANPGTSEMHFVAALDRHPQMRCVLCLAEGVVTGAADGFARMVDRPAVTLLHLGPGLGNGGANLHNARRARSPVVNVVGDHASYHLALDAPLTSDLDGIARPFSDRVLRLAPGDDVAAMTRDAVRSSRSGPGVTTMILPADVAWSEAGSPDPATPSAPERRGCDAAGLAAAIELLGSGDGRTAIFLGGAALRADMLALAGDIAAATGAGLWCETACARIERGAGRVPIRRLPYPVDMARDAMADYAAIVLIGARAPVAFFAYPGKRGRILPAGCTTLDLAGPTEDVAGALNGLAAALVRDRTPPAVPALPDAPGGTARLTSDAVARIVARRMPEQAVISDESITSAPGFFGYSQGAAPHDYMALTGGAIGQGIPLATGAAIAAPGRKVITLQADGSAMYSLQGLWTQAREALDVVTVIFSNRSYRILQHELRNVGATAAGPSANRMMSLADPALDWVALARGMGVEAARADTVAAFDDLFRSAMARPGPFLIEADTTAD